MPSGITTQQRTDGQRIAERCADNIKLYWAKKGHKVKVKVHPVGTDHGRIYEIKSDMIDGLPRDYRKVK